MLAIIGLKIIGPHGGLKVNKKLNLSSNKNFIEYGMTLYIIFIL